MQLPVEHLFGPHVNGISCANEALTRFMRMVHANWDEASRARAPHLVRADVRPIAEQLTEVRLTLRERCELGDMYMFGLDYSIEFGAQMSAASVAALREALPLSATFDAAGFVGIDVQHLQHDRSPLAALSVFHDLLLRTGFWNTELAGTGIDLATLGVFAALDPHLSVRTDPEVFMQQFKKLNAATGLGDFHVLDVLSRLFNPQYVLAGLRSDAIELLPEKLLAELK